MHFAQFKAYSECNSCTPGLSAITATAPLWATIQTTALAKVLSKSLSCRVGNKVAGVQSADVEGGDQQVDKWGQAVLQTGTNTATLCIPVLAHIILGPAPVAWQTWLPVLTCWEPKSSFCLKCLAHPQGCFSSPVHEMICASFWLSISEWTEQKQKWFLLLKMVLSLFLSKEPLSLHNCFCCREPGVEFSKYYRGKKSDATHHHTILGFFLEFKQLRLPFPWIASLESLGIHLYLGHCHV